MRALKEFAVTLKDSSDKAELNLRIGELKTSSLHRRIKKDGFPDMFSLELADESDGTRRLMALVPGIERFKRDTSPDILVANTFLKKYGGRSKISHFEQFENINK